MNGLEKEIARFLAGKAMAGERSTYQQVGNAVGWNHPNGRGLGQHLQAILLELADRRLPPLTCILVEKGQWLPPEGAQDYIRQVIGDVDVAKAQDEVFAFDWSSVPDLAPTEAPAEGPQVWLTSFWGFDPVKWGCIGFADEPKRQRFLRLSKPGDLVAIYVTKGRGPEDMRGKVVGILEISHRSGDAQEFVSADRWAEKERDRKSKGKWRYAVQATRAWMIAPEKWQAVENLFPETYRIAHPEFIGSSGVRATADEAAQLLSVDVYETPVYGQTGAIVPDLQPLRETLQPSRAIPPATAPYWVGETDGPKHLYILKLEGDVARYLGRSPLDVEEMSIIKVGFSKSPLSRRNQIQSAYPQGAFNWTVLRPAPIPEIAPYPNATIAIAGEDARKRRLVEENAEVLGGEFFLAKEWLVLSTWAAGAYAAAAAMKDDEADAA